MPKVKGKGSSDKRSKQEERRIREALKKERKAGSYLHPGDPDFKSFATQLSIQGLALKDVAGDGNCLFRALSDQLNDGHSNHLAIRRAVVSYMRDNREHFASFMEEDFDDYITSLARDGEYAGNDAIVAFSRCYGVHVVIHQLNEPRFEVHTPSAVSDTTKTVHIAYLNGEHYCSVQPLPHAESATLPTPLPRGTGDTGKGEGNAPTSKRKGTTSFVESSTSLSPAEKVVVATGCQDMELVEQCLRENSNDSELAVVEVLQLMSLGHDDDNPPAPMRHLLSDAHLHMPATSAQDPPSTSGGRISTAMKPSSLTKPLTAESPSSSLKPTKPTQPQYHQHHLSNRERKEQAKAARKQRRTQKWQSKTNCNFCIGSSWCNYNMMFCVNYANK